MNEPPADQPQASRRGWLRNNNPPGDLSRVACCGARTRRGSGCRSPAMPNGRCRMHGGGSTGPKTAAGRERVRRAVTKHGRYSAAAVAQRRYVRQLLRESQAFLCELKNPS
jgi:hypothetical protein